MLSTGQGLLTIENNLFVETGQSIILMTLATAGIGSVFRFNTVVHADPVDSFGAHINCSGSIELTSNIIALSTSMPLGVQCAAHDTLFDQQTSPVPAGTNNQAADAATFFVDRAAGDLHPTSPAKGAGESGLVEVDFDGNPRPATESRFRRLRSTLNQ